MSLWIQYKAKGGETLQSLVKQFRIKDPKVLTSYPGNKRIAKTLMSKKALNKGDIVWHPNPKAKAYRIPGPKGESIVGQKEYQKWLLQRNRDIDRAYRRILVTMTSARERHDAQTKINEDQWIVAAIAGLAAGDPPVGQRKKAEAAFKKLTGAVNSRNYKVIAKTIEPTGKAVYAYSRAVHAWVDGLIGGAETATDALEFTRDVGMMCGTIAAVTITAPASIPAAILVGATANTSVGLAYDGAEIVGQSSAGVKTTSGSELLNRALKRAATGAVSGAIAGAIGKYGMNFLARQVGSSRFITAHANRLAGTQFSRGIGRFFTGASRKVIEAELQIGAKAGTKLLADVSRRATIKVLTRVGVGGVMKLLTSGALKKLWDGHTRNFVAQGGKKLQGKSAEEVAHRAADEAMKSGLADDIFREMLRAYEKQITAEIVKELRAHNKKK